MTDADPTRRVDLDLLISNLRDEANIADRPGQYDRLNAAADVVVDALEYIRRLTAERDALARRLDTMRAVLADHPDPTCRVHPDNDPVQCGWKRAYTTLRDLLIQP